MDNSDKLFLTFIGGIIITAALMMSATCIWATYIEAETNRMFIKEASEIARLFINKF